MNSNKVKTVALILSEKCNLNCVYCYEHNKDYMVMDKNVAKSALIKEFNNAIGYDSLEIHFHGGEPFLMFPLVKELSEWIWEQDFEKSYILFATSNGTALNKESKEWLLENKNRFIVGLSLDGTKRMHDLNRSNSYDMIDRKFFLETWPEQSVKMTVSPLTLDNLSDGIIEITEQGFKVQANMALGMDWSSESLQKELANQLRKLSDYYLQNADANVSSILRMNLGLINESDQTPMTKSCGSGEHMIAYGPDGNIYPCHTFMPSVNYGKTDNEKIWATVNKCNFIDDHCSNCLIRHQCSTCYGLNYYRCGDPGKRDLDYCNINKIRAKAISYFYGKMLLNPEKYQNRLNFASLGAIANGVVLIQKYID